MTSLPERVAHLALSKFDSLPRRCKPRTLPDGSREWTPMSAVVLAQEARTDHLTCVSLATGTKCLSASALPNCKGLVLHDSHAEVLALRGFNHWLLSEVRTIVENPDYRSPYLESHPRETTNIDHNGFNIPQNPPFRIKDDVSIHFFTTEAPCGDASMEILMESFPADAATPWQVDDNTAITLQGRGHFSLLGFVRRKPARADAEPSLSKSCTDKLAVKQFTSVISFPADLFVQTTRNAYIDSIVVYVDQYNPTGYQRAFGPSGRLSRLSHAGHFFRVKPLLPDFPRFLFEKRQQSSNDPTQARPKVSNISSLWVRRTGTDGADVVEVLINGVKQGYKQWDERSTKASVVSRRELWKLGARLGDCLESYLVNGLNGELAHHDTDWLNALRSALSASAYDEAKSSSPRHSYGERKGQVTEALGNWTKNSGDDHWGYNFTPSQASPINS